MRYHAALYAASLDHEIRPVSKHWRKSALEAAPRLKRLAFDFFPYGPHELTESEAMAVVAQALSPSVLLLLLLC